MNNKENKIPLTYERLMDIYRREKNNPELQELPDNFIEDVIEYLRLKEKEVKSLKDENDLLLEEDIMQEERQLINAKKIIAKIYELREAKIIEIAKNKAITKNLIVNTNNMLFYEKEFYNFILGVFQSFRSSVLDNIISSKVPQLPQNIFLQKEENNNKKIKKIKVEFLTLVPEFVDIEGNKYGPYSEHEIDLIPEDIAQILMNKKKCRIFE
ncbi:MAG: hypothetical protein QXR30_04430 [Candidatus Woesearchaeota archaeon]